MNFQLSLNFFVSSDFSENFFNFYIKMISPSNIKKNVRKKRNFYLAIYHFIFMVKLLLEKENELCWINLMGWENISTKKILKNVKIHKNVSFGNLIFFCIKKIEISSLLYIQSTWYFFFKYLAQKVWQNIGITFFNNAFPKSKTSETTTLSQNI